MSTFFVNEADPTVAKGNNSRLAVEPGVSAPPRVGGTVRIEGEIYCQQDVLVEGEIAGSLMLPEHTLTIGLEANVKANIKAKNVVLLGTVEGSIQASERAEIAVPAVCSGTSGVPGSWLKMAPTLKGRLRSFEKLTPAQSL